CYTVKFPVRFPSNSSTQSISSGVAITVEDLFELRKHLPVVDVRSESEWRQGHIPGTINIPLLNDAERVVVGTTYKQKGQKEAIREGFRLVGPRLGAMVQRAEEIGSEFIVHCWRRSEEHTSELQS